METVHRHQRSYDLLGNNTAANKKNKIKKNYDLMGNNTAANQRKSHIKRKPPSGIWTKS